MKNPLFQIADNIVRIEYADKEYILYPDEVETSCVRCDVYPRRKIPDALEELIASCLLPIDKVRDYK